MSNFNFAKCKIFVANISVATTGRKDEKKKGCNQGMKLDTTKLKFKVKVSQFRTYVHFSRNMLKFEILTWLIKIISG